MAQETFLVVVKEDGSVEVTKKIAGIGKAAEGTNKALDFMKRTLATLGIGLGIRELAAYADTYTEVTNNIQKNVKSVAELNAVQSRLFDISQKTRTSLASNADLYDRLAGSASDLGVSQNQLLQFLEATNLALRLQSGSAELSRKSILQLFQVFRGGNVDAAELNGILKQTPDLAQAAADGIAEAGGSVAKLTALINSGRITSRQFFDAVNSQVPELQEKFSRLAPTIGSAFTVLGNSLTKFIGEVNQSSDASRILGSAIIFVADNIGTFAKTLALAVSGLVAYKVATFLAYLATLDLRKAVLALTAALLKNPFIFIATAIVTAISAVVLFKEELSKLSEPTKKVIIEIARFIDNAIGGFLGAVNVIGNAWSHLGPILGHAVIVAANIILGNLQKLIDGAVKLLNDFSKSVGGAGLITPPQIVLDDPYKDALKNAGEDSAKIFGESFGKGFQSLAKDVLTPKPSGEGGVADLNSPLGAGTVTLTQQQQGAFDQLLKSLDPVKSAMVEVAKAQELINLAMKAGIINAEEAAKLTLLLSEKYKDQLDPLMAVNTELNRQINLLKLDTDEREVQSQLFDLTKKLREQGVLLTQQENDALQQHLEILQQVNKESQIRAQILQDLQGPAETYNNSIKVLNDLLSQGIITQVQFNEKLRDTRIAFLDTQTDAASGFERAGLKMMKSAEDLASIMEEGLTNAANTAADALANFAMTGQLNFKQLVNSILGDITRLASKQVTNQLFGNLFGGSSSGSSGGLGGILSSLFGGGGSGGGFGGFFSSLGFANTGSFTVGGTGGPDSQMVAFRGSPGETVTVSKPGSGPDTGANGATIIFNVSTPDTNSFMRSQNQLMARAQASLTRAQRRNM